MGGRFYDPTMHAFSIAVERAEAVAAASGDGSPAASAAGAAPQQPGDGAASGGRLSGLLGALQRLRAATNGLARFSVLIAAIAFKIAEWWFSPDAEAARAPRAGGAAGGGAIPPPVPPPIVSDAACATQRLPQLTACSSRQVAR